MTLSGFFLPDTRFNFLEYSYSHGLLVMGFFDSRLLLFREQERLTGLVWQKVQDSGSRDGYPSGRDRSAGSRLPDELKEVADVVTGLFKLSLITRCFRGIPAKSDEADGRSWVDSGCRPRRGGSIPRDSRRVWEETEGGRLKGAYCGLSEVKVNSGIFRVTRARSVFRVRKWSIYATLRHFSVQVRDFSSLF